MSDQPGPIDLVTDYFKSLQASICETLLGLMAQLNSVLRILKHRVVVTRGPASLTVARC